MMQCCTIAVEYINSNMFSWQVELPQPLGLCMLYMYKYRALWLALINSLSPLKLSPLLLKSSKQPVSMSNILPHLDTIPAQLLSQQVMGPKALHLQLATSAQVNSACSVN